MALHREITSAHGVEEIKPDRELLTELSRMISKDCMRIVGHQ